jgi:hypothetical protein
VLEISDGALLDIKAKAKSVPLKVHKFTNIAKKKKKMRRLRKAFNSFQCGNRVRVSLKEIYF